MVTLRFIKILLSRASVVTKPVSHSTTDCCNSAYYRVYDSSHGSKRRLYSACLLLLSLVLTTYSVNAQTVGDGVEMTSLNDWGSGFIATFEYEVQVQDSPLTDWTFDFGYSGSAQLVNAWMSGYGGSISSGYIAPDGGFQVTNHTVGYKPTLQAGNTLTVNIQGQGSGFAASDFAISFDNFKEEPDNNTAPVVLDLAISTQEDTAVPILLTGTDNDGDALSFSVVDHPSNGVLTGSSSNLEYVPAENFNGDDTFTYIASDGEAESAPATVTLTVSAVNDIPTVTTQSITISENTPHSIALVATDVDGDSLVLSIIDSPQNGTVTINGSEAVYTPFYDFTGADEFTYIANDGALDSSPANISITVNAAGNIIANVVDIFGIARDFNAFFLESFTSTSSDTQGRLAAGGDVTLDSYGVASVLGSQPETPTLVVGGDLTYGQGKIFVGSALVGGSIAGVNQTVTLGMESEASITGETTLPFDIAAEFSQLEQRSQDLAQVTPTGSVVYQYGGVYLTGDCQSDIQVFTIDGPELHSANHIVPDCVPQSSAILFNIAGETAGLANIGLSQFDSQSTRTLYNFFEATKLQFTSVGIEGSVLAPLAHVANPRGNIDGTIIARSWNGPMELHDFPLEADFSSLLSSDDGPAPAPENQAPVAESLSIDINEDVAVTITLIASDADGDELTYTVTGQPTNGVLSGVAPTLTYTPNVGFSGTDVFTFAANDGEVVSNEASVSVTTQASNRAPVAEDSVLTLNEDGQITFVLSANDEDGDALTYTVVTEPLSGVLTNNDSTYIYTPELNFHGSDALSFSASDDQSVSNLGVISFEVLPVNDAPIVSDLDFALLDTESVAFSLPAEDNDSNTLAYTLVETPDFGTISGTAPNLVYTPVSGFEGNEELQFKTNDGELQSNVGIVTFTVTSTNTPPIISPLSISTDEGVSATVTINATDAENDELSFSIVEVPLHGIVTLQNSQLTYLPDPNYFGSDSLVIVANDGDASSAPATVSILIAEVNSAPEIISSLVETLLDEAVEIDLSGTDVDEDTLVYEIINPPVSGDISGTLPLVTYTPAPGFFGTDSFSFQANDGRLESTIEIIDILVIDPNVAPVAEDLNFVTVSDRGLEIILSATDVDNDLLSYSIVDSPQFGTLDGTPPQLIYTATPGYSGLDSFTYVANDGTEDSNIGTVSFTVTENMAPIAIAQVIETDEDAQIPITLSATDAEDDALTFVVIDSVQNGSLTGTVPNLVYTPNLNYTGADQFSFVANDGQLNSELQQVEISVLPINDPPAVDAGLDQTVRLDESIVFRASASDFEGPIESYIWKDETDAVVSESQGFVVRGLAEGIYTYTVEVTDNAGLGAQDSVVITVIDQPLEPGVLTGTVYDKRGAIIVNARVSVPNAGEVVTNEFGEYRIDNIAPTPRIAVTAERAEFLDNSEVVALIAGQETRQDIVLSRPAVTQIVDTEAGGTVEGDGLTIEVPPEIELVTQSGDPVEGNVEFRASYFQSTSDEDMVEFPGDSIGTNELGSTGSLVSYGFVKLDIVDSIGTPLEIADGQSMEISIPADDSLDTPDTIPFWFFDEESAEWVQDGVATYDPTTQSYRASINRVATFNVDAFLDILATVEICLVDENGNGVPGYIGLEPVDKSWRNISETSDAGTLIFFDILAERAFNFYAASRDGLVSNFSGNPVILNAGDNIFEECFVVSSANRANSFSVTGTIETQNNDPIGNQAYAKIFGDAGGEFQGAPSTVSLGALPISDDGTFNFEFDESSPLAIELAMFGSKEVTLTARSGGNLGEQTLILEDGIDDYPFPSFQLFPNQPPVAQAGGDAQIHEGDAVLLDGSRSVDPDDSVTFYEWRIGDNVLSNSRAYNLTGLSKGIHTIILTVEDEFGARGSDDLRVEVLERFFDIYADAGLDQTTYVGERIFISGNSQTVGGPLQYSWTSGSDVLSTSSGFNFENVGLPGVHTIRLEVTNEGGLVDTDEMTLTVAERGENAIYADAGLDQTVYVGEIAPFSSRFTRSVGSSIASLQWIEDGEVLSATSSFSYPDTSVPGVHTITLLVTNEYGIEASDEVTLTIVERGENFIYADAGLDRTLYVGDRFNLSGTGSLSVGSNIAYQWNLAGTTISNSSVFALDTSIPGEYVYTLTVTNEYGLIETDEVVIDVIERERHLLFADAGLDQSIFVGSTATFISDVLSIGSELSGREWRLNGEVIDTTSAFIFRDTEITGEYIFELTAINDAGLVETDEVVLTIVERGENSIFADAGLDRTVYVDDSARIGPGNTISVGSPISYLWSEDGVTLSTSSSFIYPDTSMPGTHAIRLDVTNEFGLTDSDEIVLNIQERTEHSLSADAGLDQTVYVGDFFILRGEDTVSVGSNVASYRWFENGVDLNNRSSSSNFSIHDNDIVGVRTFQLAVTNHAGLEETDEVQVNIIADGTGFVYADAGPDDTVDIGQSSTLIGTFSRADAGRLTYEWTENGEVLSTRNWFHYQNTDSPGVRTIDLRVTDPNGLEAFDQVLITVRPPAPTGLDIYADAGGDEELFLGSSLWLGQHGSYSTNGSLRCTWTENEVVLFSSCSTFTYTPATPGVHALTLVVENTNGLVDSDTATITVLEGDQRLYVDAGRDESIYLNEEVILDGSRSYSIRRSLQSCEWTVDGVVVLDRCSATRFEPATPGEHVYTLTVIDEDGAQATDEKIVVVREREMRILADAGVDRVMYLGNSEHMTLGDSFTLTSSFETCLWNEGGIVVHDTCNSFFYEPITVGPHTLQLTVTDRDGLTDSDEVVITVEEREQRVYADAGVDTSIFLGNNVRLFTNESYSLSADHFTCEWSLDGEILSNNCNFFTSYIPTNLGINTFTLTITDTDGLQDSDDVNVNVVERDKDIYADAGPDVSMFLGNDLRINSGESYSLTSTFQCEWQEDGVVFSNSCSTNARYTPSSLGEHVLKLSIVDGDGLEDSDEMTVTVIERDMRIYADAGKDTTIYLGERLRIDDGQSYSLTSFLECEWSEGSEILRSNSCARWTYIPTTLGTHTLTLNVRDRDGLEDTDEVDITVVERDMRIFADAGLDRSVYLGSTFYLDDGDSYSLSSSISCEWALDGEPLSTSSSCSRQSFSTPESAGEYTYTLTVRDFNGLEISDDMVLTVVERDQRVFADAGLDQSIFLGQRIDVGDRNESYSIAESYSCQWLQDGLAVGTNCNFYRFVPDRVGLYTFSIIVTGSDGLSDTDEVNILVLDPAVEDTTPPVLTLSGTPSISIIQGTDFIEPGVTAFDSRDGVLTESILVNGSSLSVHLIGSYELVYSVADRAGNSTTAVRTVNVLPVGSDILAPSITLNGSNPTTIVQNNTYNDAGAEVVDNVDGPLGYTFDSNVNTDRQGVYWVIYTAEDSVGNQSQETRFVRVTDAAGNIDIQGPVITLLGESPILFPQGDVYIDEGATATDNIDGNLTANIEIADPVDTSIIGEYAVRYNVTDAAGNTGFATRLVSVVDPADIPDIEPPTLRFVNLEEGAVIATPTDVLADVIDETLVSWKLSFRSTSESEFRVLASGNMAVESGTIATFDPTLLMNGPYELLLDAIDEGGLISREQVVVVVDGDMKVGTFSISFLDLSIPMVGIPIEITRTYDSRQRNEALDFGHGWSIDYQSVDLEETSVPGEGWSFGQEFVQYDGGGFTFPILQFCVTRDEPAYVTVTLPDNSVERFLVKANPDCNVANAILDVQLEFEPQDGTTSTLRALDDRSGRLNTGLGILSDIARATPLNPTRYELTTKSGFVYTIHQDDGIETIEDPNGNTLTYSRNGISHSAGKSIQFIRDGKGRITEIEDPNGNLITYTYDINDDLGAVTDRAFATTSFTYNSSHGLVEIEDPLGEIPLKNIYDDSGRLIAQEDNEGNRTEFNHNLAGRESIVTDRLGRTTFFYYDERGNVTSRVNALGEITTYTYGVHNNRLSETNSLGESTSATFDSENNQLTQTNGLGNTVSFSYNSMGQETEITDELGREYQNIYDSSGNLVSISDPTGNTATQTIGLNGLVVARTDSQGYTIQLNYDGEGSIIRETDAEGGVREFTYDENKNRTSESVKRTVNGTTITEISTYAYDNQDRQIQITDSLGNVSSVEYDLKGQKVARIDARGQRTEMSYDAYGRLIQTNYPDGTSSNHTYDLEGNKLSYKDRRSHTTNYTYDALNRVISTVYPDGSNITNEYDAAGRLISITDERGNSTRYEFNTSGQRIAIEDALGNRHTYDYDAVGNIQSETDANNITISYSYNNLDQRTHSTYSDGNTITDGLDALGRRIKRTDEAGVPTEYTYDGLGRLTMVTDALVNATNYDYDETGNLMALTDTEGRTTSWAYDALGRVKSRTLPIGQKEIFGYDENGNLISHIDFNGDMHRFLYDNNDRISEARYADGSSTDYNYDAVGNLVQSSITDSTGKRTWDNVYDNRDRLIKQTKPDGSILTYRYDATGNRIQLVMSLANGDTETVNYTYDAVNRLESVTNGAGTSSYGYDAVGNRTSLSYTNGASQTWEYDSRNRLKSTKIFNANGAMIQSFDYTLHPTGRRLNITELSGRTSDYTYDKLYRLTTESVSDEVNGVYNASYQFDTVGNRIQSEVNGLVTQYNYDANDRLLQQGGVTYTYDANGNTLSEDNQGTLQLYSWNSQNQLIEHMAGGSTTNFDYNTDGIRHNQSDGNSTIHYLIDSNRNFAQVLAERVDELTDVIYHFGNDLISQNRAGSENYFHSDGLGSTRVLTNDAGNETDIYAFSAFGEVLIHEGITDNQYLYTGEQYDDSLDQYYLRARYYDHSIGRFTQLDSFEGLKREPSSQNKYYYTPSDPVNFTDPSGLFFGNIQAVKIQAELAQAEIATKTLGILPRVVIGLTTAGFVVFSTGDQLQALANNPAAQKELELKRRKVEQAFEVEARTNRTGGGILFHYTDRGAALDILGTGLALTTPRFAGLATGGISRPAGFYATDIQPWNISYTQESLSALFYGGDVTQDVSWFVAVEKNGFLPVSGTREYFKVGFGGQTSVEVISIGPNLMKSR